MRTQITILLILFISINISMACKVSSQIYTNIPKNKNIDTTKLFECGHGSADIYHIPFEALLDFPIVELEDEQEINDIPFDTKKIANNLLIKKEISLLDESNFIMLEEQECNDIPFNTHDIIIQYTLDKAEFKMEEEKEVNDIPFNTHKIYMEYQQI